MDDRSRQWERRFELPVIVAALLVIPVIAVEESDVGEPWRALAGAANWLIWLVFAIELVVMLVVTPRRWQWLRRHPLEVAVVLLTPPFLPSSLQAARLLRLFRLLRLLRVARTAQRLFSLEGVRWVAVLVLLTALAGGAAFAEAEGESTWDGVWWAVVTLTTVGYGDLTPETTIGRIVGLVVMLTGIGFVAILTGAIAQRFVSGQLEEEADDVRGDVAREVESAESEVLRELRFIGERLTRVEAALAERDDR